MVNSSAVVIRRQNQYMEKFNRLGATEPQHAISLEEAGIRRSFLFDRMCDRGVFVQCNNGKFYINNRAAADFKEMRRGRAFAVLLCLLAVIAVMFVLGLLQ